MKLILRPSKCCTEYVVPTKLEFLEGADQFSLSLPHANCCSFGLSNNLSLFSSADDSKEQSLPQIHIPWH